MDPAAVARVSPEGDAPDVALSARLSTSVVALPFPTQAAETG